MKKSIYKVQRHTFRYQYAYEDCSVFTCNPDRQKQQDQILIHDSTTSFLH
jgi:hypothetical protein